MTIAFKTELFNIGDRTILLLPADASKQLPSRNIAMVHGTINGVRFQDVLEPDGNFSHWLEIGPTLRANANVSAGDTVSVTMETSKDWIEPQIPKDVKDALASNTEAHDTWQKVTPMARWEWLRWIRATNNDETRAKRIQVACSKLKSGMRRPCCFNTSACTVPEVSKSGVLLAPAL